MIVKEMYYTEDVIKQGFGVVYLVRIQFRQSRELQDLFSVKAVDAKDARIEAMNIIDNNTELEELYWNSDVQLQIVELRS